MGQIEAILFDPDGTLVQYQRMFMHELAFALKGGLRCRRELYLCTSTSR